MIPFIQDNIERIESISYIDVYGGGQKDGKPVLKTYDIDDDTIELTLTDLRHKDEGT